MSVLKAALESKNNRLMGLENMVRELEAENQALRHQRPDGSYPSLVLFKSSVFAKLGTVFFFLSLGVFALHITKTVRIEQLIIEAETMVSSLLSFVA